jgi:hypothetical protein
MVWLVSGVIHRPTGGEVPLAMSIWLPYLRADVRQACPVASSIFRIRVEPIALPQPKAWVSGLGNKGLAGGLGDGAAKCRLPMAATGRFL